MVIPTTLQVVKYHDLLSNKFHCVYLNGQAYPETRETEMYYLQLLNCAQIKLLQQLLA